MVAVFRSVAFAVNALECCKRELWRSDAVGAVGLLCKLCICKRSDGDATAFTAPACAPARTADRNASLRAYFGSPNLWNTLKKTPALQHQLEVVASWRSALRCALLEWSL